MRLSAVRSTELSLLPSDMQIQVLLSQVDSGTNAESAELAIASYLDDAMAPIQPFDNPCIHPDETIKLLLAIEGCTEDAALRRTR